MLGKTNMARENMHDRLIEALGVVLQERRSKLNLSQSDLAQQSEFHRSYISDVERGARNISLRNLSRLAEALETQVSTLIVSAERKLHSRARR